MKIFNSEQINETKHLTKREIIELLKAKGKIQEDLFRRARIIRAENDVNQIKFYGVIELGNNYYFSQLKGEKYSFKQSLNCQQVQSIAKQIKSTHIDTVVLRCVENFDCESILEEVIPHLRDELNLNVLLSLGEKTKEAYQKYSNLGANAYLLKFEASDPMLYQRINNKSLRKRLKCIHHLQQLNYKIGTGNLIGLPEQTLENIAEDILLTIEMQPEIICCSPVISKSNYKSQINLVLNSIAIYRLALQKSRIIAASNLEKIESDGQLKAINAGANVLNINFTPAQFRHQYAMYAQQRFASNLNYAVNITKRAGLEVNVFEKKAV